MVHRAVFFFFFSAFRVQVQRLSHHRFHTVLSSVLVLRIGLGFAHTVDELRSDAVSSPPFYLFFFPSSSSVVSERVLSAPLEEQPRYACATVCAKCELARASLPRPALLQRNRRKKKKKDAECAHTQRCGMRADEETVDCRVREERRGEERREGRMREAAEAGAGDGRRRQMDERRGEVLAGHELT